MQLLVGIHVDPPNKWKFNEFIAERFRAEPNTFFLAFNAVPRAYVDMRKLCKPAGVPSGRIIEINYAPHLEGKSASFAAYEKNFEKEIGKIFKKSGENEKVSVIFFGRFATGCYKNICKGALSDIVWRFGRYRLASAESYLPEVSPKANYLLPDKAAESKRGGKPRPPPRGKRPPP